MRELHYRISLSFKGGDKRRGAPDCTPLFASATQQHLEGKSNNNRYNGPEEAERYQPGDFVFLEVFCVLRLIHIENLVFEDAAERN